MAVGNFPGCLSRERILWQAACNGPTVRAASLEIWARAGGQAHGMVPAAVGSGRPPIGPYGSGFGLITSLRIRSMATCAELNSDHQPSRSY